MVMKGLHALDKVAYIRFASVYQDFNDVPEFVAEIQEPITPNEDSNSLSVRLCLARPHFRKPREKFMKHSRHRARECALQILYKIDCENAGAQRSLYRLSRSRRS